ncbi:MAG: tetratricopeptide repeat protein [Planctomycetes bacterium]|nr:tetratricopeptide repeat protein [Planctomycetota bacterium]
MTTRISPDDTALEALLVEAADVFTDALQRGEHPQIEQYAQRHPLLATMIRQVFPALLVLEPAADDQPDLPVHDDDTGTLGDYRILREIGRGGMGIVYEAEQISLGRRVALKVLPFAAMLDKQQLARFANEARTAATLDHPNIVHVTDFGLARIEADAGMTMTGDLLGTLRYMSPEQASGSHFVDQRSDIYSLGATLYELLTLQPVFAGNDRQKLLRQIPEQDPRPPRQLNNAIPKDLETIVLKAIAKEPQSRYATAQALADDLRRFLEDKPIRARRPGPWVRLRMWTKRHQGPTITAAAVVFLSLAVAGGWKLQRDRESREITQSVRESLAAAQASIAAGDDLRASTYLGEAKGRLANGNDTLGTLAAQTDGLLAQVEARLADQERLAQFQKLVEQFHSHGLATAWVVRKRGYEYCRQALQLYRADEDLPWTRQPAVENLTAQQSEPLKDSVFELLVLLADWQIHAPGKQPRPDDYRRAIELLTRAEHGYAPTRSLYQRRSGYWSAVGDEQAARADAARAAAIEPVLALDRYLLGDACRREGQPAEALEQFSQAIRLKPDHFLSLFRMGTCLRALERAAEAELAFTACIALQPDSPYSYQWRAYVCAQQGKEQQALEDYQKAIERGDYVAFLHRGFLHGQHGRSAEAIADFTRAIETNPSSYTSYNNRASEYARKGKYDKALADYNKAIALKRNSPDFYCNRAILYARYKHSEEARADFKAVLEIDPNFAKAYHCRAQLVWIPAKEFQQAIEDFTKAIEIEPKNPDHYRHRAASYAAIKRYDGVLADWNKIVELKPDSAFARNSLAWFLATCPDPQFRDPKRAAEQAKKAVERAPKNGSYWNTLGIAQYRAGDWKAAIEALEKSMELGSGGNSFDWFFLAMAHRQLGSQGGERRAEGTEPSEVDHNAEAQRWYEQAVEWMKKNRPDDGELIRFRNEAAKLLRLPDEAAKPEEKQPR